MYQQTTSTFQHILLQALHSLTAGNIHQATHCDAAGLHAAFCRCPKLVANRISLLIGHLGGKAYSLRSAIITAIGNLIQKAFENVPGEDADAQGTPTYHRTGPVSESWYKTQSVHQEKDAAR